LLRYFIYCYISLWLIYFLVCHIFSLRINISAFSDWDKRRLAARYTNPEYLFFTICSRHAIFLHFTPAAYAILYLFFATPTLGLRCRFDKDAARCLLILAFRARPSILYFASDATTFSAWLYCFLPSLYLLLFASLWLYIRFILSPRHDFAQVGVLARLPLRLFRFAFDAFAGGIAANFHIAILSLLSYAVFALSSRLPSRQDMPLSMPHAAIFQKLRCVSFFSDTLLALIAFLFADISIHWDWFLIAASLFFLHYRYFHFSILYIFQYVY